MAGCRVPGPECISDNLTLIDLGTNIRQQSTAPGTVQPTTIPAGHDTFKAWALDEAATGVYAIEFMAWKDDYKAISRLSGDFLRMYLDHKTDPDILKAAAKEIGDSAEWEPLATDTQDALQKEVDRRKSQPSASDLTAFARDYLITRYKKEGIAFRGPLNPIIGGIEGIDVVEPTTIRVQRLSNIARITYTLHVKVSDQYKFLGNRRSGGAKGTIADQADYDAQRRRWAGLLATGDYASVFKEYHRDFYFGGPKLNHGYAFASLMYALEAALMTPGPLPWSVIIPMEGQISAPP